MEMSSQKKPLDDEDHEPNLLANYNLQPVKSMQELKEYLLRLMSLDSANPGDFATGGLLAEDELSVVPLIDVKGYGILSFPLNEKTFDMIKDVSKQSPYGMGEETLVDTAVRNSYQLEPNQFEIKNEKFVKQISSLIQGKIKSALGLEDATIHGKIYKLLIYEKGGKFDEHRDTEKEDDMFGTLIVQLPSVFDGGDLVVKHLKSSRVYKNSCLGSSTQCIYVAHYASCPHELKEVTSGFRAALIYSLCWKGNGMKPSPNVVSTNAVNLCNTLNMLIDSPEVPMPYICWALDYEYSTASIRSNSLNFFKGNDKNVAYRLKNALDYDRMQCGTDNWQLFIASANKHVNELGDCSYRGESDGSGCGQKCEMNEGERYFFVDEFIPLTENSSTSETLQFNLLPDKEMINFPKKKELVPTVKSFSHKRNRHDDSDEEFWGEDDLGEGCSGPSGNEGASRVRWYKKKVLIMWKTESSLAMRCKLSMKDAVSHILDLAKKGNLEDGKIGFQILLSYLDNQNCNWNEKMVTEMLEMCNILKLKENVGALLEKLKQFAYNATEIMISVISDSILLFPIDEHKNTAKEIIKRVNKNKIELILDNCDCMKWIKPDELLDLLVNYVIAPKSSGYSFHHCSIDGCNSTAISITLLLKYMIDKDTFPSNEFDRLVESICQLSYIVSAILMAIHNSSVTVLNKLVVRFVELAATKTNQPFTSYKTYDSKMSTEDGVAIHMVFKALVSGFQTSCTLGISISLLVRTIMSLSNDQQPLLKLLVSEIVEQFQCGLIKENFSLQSPLKEACDARFKFLEQTVGEGEPVMSWHQENATFPGHPEVEAFFRGPEKTFIFRGQTWDMYDARNWALRNSDHGKYRRYYATMTPSGVGSNVIVTVVKTMEGYEKKVAAYRDCLKEYERILRIVQRDQKRYSDQENKENDLDDSGLLNVEKSKPAAGITTIDQ